MKTESLGHGLIDTNPRRVRPTEGLRPQRFVTPAREACRRGWNRPGLEGDEPQAYGAIEGLGLPTADHYTAVRLQRAFRNMRSCVEVHPARAGGRPVLKGTRFTVAQVLSQMAEGDSVDDLVENFRLDGDSIRCLLKAMSVAFDRTFHP